ncbi:hypothetical protein MP228_000754 [Amoeboaphelidium protococcarum]|nr:hypothetical protein MP228_000754 [Amoeboaphelidium protococcarum]
MSEQKQDRKFQKSPEENAWFLSRLVYTWLDQLIFYGYKHPLQHHDLYPLTSDSQASHLADRFEKAFDDIKSKTPEGGKVSVYQVLKQIFGWEYGLLAIPMAIQSACNIASPVFIGLLTQFAVNSASAATPADRPPLYLAAIYSVIFFVLQFFATLFQNRYYYFSMKYGMQARACLTATTYRKLIKLSSLSRQKYSSGQILNIVSSDLTRVEMLFWQGHFLWTSPVQVIVILGLLIANIGVSALAGFGLLVLTIPVQAYVFIYLGKLRRSYAFITDDRIKRTQEFLAGMRIIKLFAWEGSFLGRLLSLRSSEVDRVKTVNVWTAILMGITMSVPLLASVVSFIVYGALNPTFNPPVIFSSLALFNLMRFPLIMLPNTIRMLVEARVAINRLSDVLNAEELQAISIGQASDKPDAPDSDNEYALEIIDGNFQWELVQSASKGDQTGKDSQQPKQEDIEANKNAVPMVKLSTLRGINLKVKKGDLVIVCGQVGSGKSSLLNAILGEMKTLSGQIRINGKIGYTMQQPWIKNGSVKDNVSFGDDFRQDQFDHAVQVTALAQDLDWLPNGANTLLGEKGVQISGGQKARVSLSRLVYCKPDIALLDDPLSAVDVNVGRHIFNECIKTELKDKTVILVTHHIEYLHLADYVVFMKDGSIAEQGTYQEVMNMKGQVADLVQNHGLEENQDEKAVTKKDKVQNENKPAGISKGMIDEERAIGSLQWSIFSSYIKAAGGPVFLAITLFLAVITQVARIGNDLWLVFWTNDQFGLSTATYSGVYFAWGISQGIFSSILGSFMAVCFAFASTKFHKDAISSVFRAPMSFFDQTPLGRIVNRFSRDTDVLDTVLPSSIQFFITLSFSLLGLIALMAYAAPFILVALVPLSIAYIFLQQLYLRTSRELKRMDAISRSPIYSQFEETMSGLSTIRAYGKQQKFVSDCQQYIDYNNEAVYLQLMCQRWIGLRLETLGSLICFFTALIGAITVQTYGLSAALYGVSLSYALQLVSSMGFVVRQFVEMEVNANSIERLHYYISGLPHEAQAVLVDKRPPDNWPSKGQVEFKNVTLKYDTSDAPVVQDLNLTIESHEKFAVVGRTGSGKSTTVYSIFRMMELAGGSIVIDDLNISEMGLADVRSKLAIIPQDPVLFSGTVRSNLDPFNKHTDEDIWQVLDVVNMKKAISQQDGKLDSKVQANGENFSTGQRQLLCLARAMLRKPKLMVMDEVTANVDFESDKLIQESIRRDFKNSTVVTIAHRLNTIIDYDRVLVLDKGRLVELDSPYNLLQKPDGIFRNMVMETGAANAQLLERLAKEKHEAGCVSNVEALVLACPSDQ